MIPFSRSDGYQPIQPHDPFIYGSEEGLVRDDQQNGLFYRTDTKFDWSNFVQEAITNPASVSLIGYQSWSETGWKTEHGSYASFQRFTEKLKEEYAELQLANEQSISSAKTSSELISELGDVLWCTMAVLSNGGVSIEGTLKSLLYDYCRGIVHYANAKPIPPSWHKQVSQISTRWDELKVGDIAQLIESGFEPTPSTVMNLEAGEFFDDPVEHLNTLKYYLDFMTQQQDRQFGYHEDHLTMENFRFQGLHLGRLGALATLEVAFLAHHLPAGQTDFCEVVKHNIQKVNGRIAEQLVDKSDGIRPENLL